VEAIELGAGCLLVDEDLSAANFMARDGRMRTLVPDESITPFLYRVNGIVESLKISTVVVIGGVGDWLDVADAVIMLENYEIKDVTKKAASIAKTFSAGHIQFAGRGTTHRLAWPKDTISHRNVFALITDSAFDDGNEIEMSFLETPCEKEGLKLALMWLKDLCLNDPSPATKRMTIKQAVEMLEAEVNSKTLHAVLGKYCSGDDDGGGGGGRGGKMYALPRSIDIGYAINRLRLSLTAENRKNERKDVVTKSGEQPKKKKRMG
jgi:hypothetical protein